MFLKVADHEVIVIFKLLLHFLNVRDYETLFNMLTYFLSKLLK